MLSSSSTGSSRRAAQDQHGASRTQFQTSSSTLPLLLLLSLCLTCPITLAQDVIPPSAILSSQGPSLAVPSASMAASLPSLAAGTIWSTQYTLRFPLTAAASLSELAPASLPVSVLPSSSASALPSPLSSSLSSLVATGQSGDVSPIMSVSQLPSLRIATVTDIWWSPVQGQGGPGVPVRKLPGPWSKFDRVVVAHAVMGSLAWLIVSPLAIVFARWSKERMQNQAATATFAAHKWIQAVFTFLLTLVAVILGGVATNIQGSSSHFSSAHQRLGLVLLLLLVLQIILGRWVSGRTDRQDRHMSVGSLAHIAGGVTLTALGFAQVYLGFGQYEEKSNRRVPVAVKAIWGIIVGLFSLYLIVIAVRSRLPRHKRQIKLRRRHAQVYETSTGPVMRTRAGGARSWDRITGAGSAGSLAAQSSRMSLPEPVRAQRTASSLVLPLSSTHTASPANQQQPFATIRPLSSSDEELAQDPFATPPPSPSPPPAAHFSSYARQPRGAAGQSALTLPIINTAPLHSAPPLPASLGPISEEGSWSAISIPSSPESASRQSAPLSALIDEEGDDSSPEESRPPSRRGSGQHRNSTSSVRRKAVPMFL